MCPGLCGFHDGDAVDFKVGPKPVRGRETYPVFGGFMPQPRPYSCFSGELSCSKEGSERGPDDQGLTLPFCLFVFVLVLINIS